MLDTIKEYRSRMTLADTSVVGLTVQDEDVASGNYQD